MIKWLFIGMLVLFASMWFFQPPEAHMGELTTLPYEVSGNPNSKTMLVFFHGYPNTFRMWDEMINELKKDFYCVNLSYPNFAENVKKSWGIDIIDIVNLVQPTIEYIIAQQPKGISYHKTFVAHDWGAFIAYLFENSHKNYVDDMIVLDIGAKQPQNLQTKLFQFAYQNYLSSAFLIGGKIGKFMTRLFCFQLAKVYGLSEDDKDRIDGSWNYLYYYLWKRIGYYKDLLSNIEVTSPMAFIYGEKKNFMFHSQEFLDDLKANEKNEVHGVDEGHWVMASEKSRKLIVDIIRRRAKTLQ